MNAMVDTTVLVPSAEMAGEDDEETALLRSLLEKARTYMSGFRWCTRIVEEFFGLGVGGVVAVFLVRIAPEGGADEWLWVVVGDLPSAYLVTDEAKDPLGALSVYCDVMEAWVTAVRSGQRLEDVFPVDAATTLDNAGLLEKRIDFIRTTIIPAFQSS